MAEVGQPFTSGNWTAKEGKQQEFVACWTEFAHWALDAMGRDAVSSPPLLIQDRSNPRHFISFGGWKDPATVDAWRGHPEFADRMGRCRALCDEFAAGDYSLASAPLA
jgi:hypothetical protein